MAALEPLAAFIAYLKSFALQIVFDFRMPKIVSSRMIIAAVGVAIATSGSAVLVACGGDSGRAAESTSVTTAIDAGSDFQIPADWPAQVPVVGGDIAVSSTAGEGQRKTWVVEFYSDDLAATWADARGQLTSAGFAQTSVTTAADGTIDAVFTGTDFVVMTKVYREADTNEDEIRYVVSRRN